MKVTAYLMLTATTVCSAILPARSQLTYSFVTSIGSGSLNLNTNNLVFTGSNGNAAGYTDTLDSLTFNGITYTNLNFSVYNNSFIVGGNDGFQILVDKSPYDSSSRLEIDVHGNSSVVNGISISDLVTVLSSFDLLKSSSFGSFTLYNDPKPPYSQQTGTVTSFQLFSTPAISSFAVQNNQFRFNITGISNQVVVVEATTNLINPVWIRIGTNTLNTFIGTNGTSDFSDPQSTNCPARFYRLSPP